MVFRKFKIIFLIGTGILAISVAGLSGCAPNDAVVAVPFQPVQSDNPIGLTTTQLYSEYVADQAAADAKYKGKRVQFTNETVEQLHGHFSTGEAFYNDKVNNPDILMDYFVVIGLVKFEPRHPTSIYGIQKGTVIDVEGYVQGMSAEGLVIIENCWISIVSGGIPSGY